MFPARVLSLRAISKTGNKQKRCAKIVLAHRFVVHPYGDGAVRVDAGLFHDDCGGFAAGLDHVHAGGEGVACHIVKGWYVD